MIVNHDRGWHNNIAFNGFVSSRLHECVDVILEEFGWDYDSSGVKPQAAPVRESFQNTWLEGHLPVDILTDWQLTPEVLRRYRVIALPNTAAISGPSAAALREYVRAGGGVVATFETSLSDEAGRRRADFALADVFGASYGGQGKSHIISAGVYGVDHPIARDEIFRRLGVWSQGAIEPARNFQIITHKPGNAQAYEIGFATPKSRPAEALRQVRAGGPELPAFVAREFGKGRVVYFPVDLGRAYFLNNSPATARLLQRAIRWAAKEPPPVELEGAEQVETVCFTKNGRLVVHLLNDQASYGRGAPPNPEGYGFRREIIPVHELKVRIHRDARRVLLVPGGRELPIARNGGAAEVTVPKLELHAMLVVE